MADMVNRMETMLFNYQTTSRTDYRRGEIRPPIFTKYQEKPKCLRVRAPPLKNQHSLAPWKTVPVPFNLMHAPRPIVGTDPNKVPKPFVKPEDMGKAEAIRTRPRVVLTPQVSLDDITDAETRNILCKSMYISSMARASKEAIGDYFTVKAPLSELPSPANPITLPPLRFPYVSPEWRKETLSWDRQQLRTYCDPTKEFWISQKLPPCPPCKETEIVEADKRMRYQMQVARLGLLP